PSCAHDPGRSRAHQTWRNFTLLCYYRQMSRVLGIGSGGSPDPVYTEFVVGARLKEHLRLVTFVLSSGLAFGSLPSAAAASPPFEVASIKPVEPKPGAVLMTGTTIYPGGRVVISNATVLEMIMAAFA